MSAKLCVTGVNPLWSSKAISVTPTILDSSPLEAIEDPHFAQNPRRICGKVSNQLGSPPGLVHSNPSTGKDTQDITGAPERH
ncbi:hypothetical protein [Nocardia altamirensis]|uniref:hypothetical protein n=1 Tax=Nocardia altamirensis TaxID=472158 RepID=UPI001FE1D6F2|nr:hypothetical protein [Nocardia altamirensis]